MTGFITAAAAAAALSLASGPPAAPRLPTLLSAMPPIELPDTGAPVSAGAPWQPAAPARDSLKNGALIGAIAGAVASVVVTYAACGLDEASGGDTSCGSELAVAAAAGAGLGALIGLGVDAIFQRAPDPAAGRQVALRLRIRF